MEVIALRDLFCAIQLLEEQAQVFLILITSFGVEVLKSVLHLVIILYIWWYFVFVMV